MANKIEIIQGEAQPFTIRLRSNGDPLDLSNDTKLDVCFKVGTVFITIAMTVVGSPLIGKITGTLSAVQTDTLPEARDETLEITVNSDGTGNVDRKFHIANAFDVLEKRCA